jgi:hypothetical protein
MGPGVKMGPALGIFDFLIFYSKNLKHLFLARV